MKKILIAMILILFCAGCIMANNVLNICGKVEMQSAKDILTKKSEDNTQGKGSLKNEPGSDEHKSPEYVPGTIECAF